jgi:hypothetical protein
MLSLLIAPDQNEPVSATLNASVDEAASVDDMRQAWEALLNGALQHQLRDAIWFECVRRGIDPRSIIVEAPGN